MDCFKHNTKNQLTKNQSKSRMTWKMRMGGFLNKKDHLLGIFKMRTSKHDNPTHIHEVNHDIVCIKENFGINPKIFHSHAPHIKSHALNAHNDVRVPHTLYIVLYTFYTIGSLCASLYVIYNN
jgi:hypothetical protein